MWMAHRDLQTLDLVYVPTYYQDHQFLAICLVLQGHSQDGSNGQHNYRLCFQTEQKLLAICKKAIACRLSFRHHSYRLSLETLLMQALLLAWVACLLCMRLYSRWMSQT